MNEINACMRESELDSTEIEMRKRMDELIAQGDFEAADEVKQGIKSLDRILVCVEEEI